MNSLVRPCALRASRHLYPSAGTSPFSRSSLSRLLSTLAILEHRDGKIAGSSLSAIAAAIKLGGPVTGFVAGKGAKSGVATEVAKVEGVETVLAVENEAYDKVLSTFVTFRIAMWQRSMLTDWPTGLPDIGSAGELRTAIS